MSTWLSDIWASISTVAPGARRAGGPRVSWARSCWRAIFQAVAVVVIGWLVLYRQWRQLTQGRSDQVVFSANLLTPIGEPSAGVPRDRFLLQLRTVLPPRTVDQLLDNVALRRVIRSLAEQASLTDPILATEGTAGFEIVNDIVNSVAGSLASASFRRDQWLLAVTCEDRKVVRKCCIRVLLFAAAISSAWRPGTGAASTSMVEEWYHFWRIVTLHQIALRFQEEQERQQGIASRISRRTSCRWSIARRIIRESARSSLGINVDEPIIKTPLAVDWDRYLPHIAELGLKLSGTATLAPGP